MRNSVTLDETIEFLNELLKYDKPAIARLLQKRTSCNEDLSNHPTVQVGGRDGTYVVGVLGILNGLFGINKNGWGEIIAVYDLETEDLVRFERTGAFLD